MDEPYAYLLRNVKGEILETSFASELEVLTSDLKQVADADRRTRDFSVNALRQALSEIIARFPVYRSYLGSDLDENEIEPEDLKLIGDTVRKAKRRSSLPDRSVHDFAQAVLLGRLDTEGPGRPDPEVVRRFRRRFQQLTGPVMAKSLEDTLFYRFVELLALNEVGGDPGEYGVTAEHFHALQAARARDWPNAMITTATHDTKRGEDARTRLLALSEVPEEWADAWALWGELAKPHLSQVEGEAAPDANDQWMFLQAILGAWPLELLTDSPDPKDVEEFRKRLGAYAEKAMREGKRRSSWVNVDEAYEGAVAKLFDALVAPDSEFLREFKPFAERLARVGMVTGLARSALKCTLPGLPDIYQGTEFWDFSFVDPDNRRPVDYAEREAALGQDVALEDLLASWPDGRIKQRVLARLLADRAASRLLRRGRLRAGGGRRAGGRPRRRLPAPGRDRRLGGRRPAGGGAPPRGDRGRTAPRGRLRRHEPAGARGQRLARSGDGRGDPVRGRATVDWSTLLAPPPGGSAPLRQLRPRAGHTPRVGPARLR